MDPACNSTFGVVTPEELSKEEVWRRIGQITITYPLL